MSRGPVSGGCLCGAVRFEIDGPLRDIIVCHCSLCRRAGTNAAAYTSAPVSAVRLVGTSTPAMYVDVNGRERSFCPICGSSLFWGEDEEWLSISAGALDADAGLRVRRHIHADSAAGWETLPEGVPTHRAGSSSPLVSDGGE